MPTARLTLRSVDAGHGPHLILMLRDGTVLDPACDRPRRLSDYGEVHHMTTLHEVPA